MLVIPRIASMIDSLKTVEPLTIHVGQVATTLPNYVVMKREDLNHIRAEDLEQSDVTVSITVQCGEETKFLLRGEWNAVEDFLSKHYSKTDYHFYMEMMDRNQFNRS